MKRNAKRPGWLDARSCVLLGTNLPCRVFPPRSRRVSFHCHDGRTLLSHSCYFSSNQITRTKKAQGSLRAVRFHVGQRHAPAAGRRGALLGDGAGARGVPEGAARPARREYLSLLESLFLCFFVCLWVRWLSRFSVVFSLAAIFRFLCYFPLLTNNTRPPICAIIERPTDRPTPR